MNIIRSVSVLILFFGILLMTDYVTRSYSMNESNFIKTKRKPTMNEIYSKYESEKPSKVFGKMFTESSVWMGYTDNDVKDSKNVNYYSLFNPKKYSSVD